MRFIVALLLVACFGALNANKAVFHELAQINKHPFGATMLAAISTNLRAKTPVSEVQTLLDKILADLQTDSVTLDNTYQSTKDEKAQAVANSHALIDTFKETISGLETSITSYEEQGVNYVAEYTDAQNTITATQADLDSLEEEHSRLAQNFEDDIANLNDAIAACNTALDKMNTYQSATGAALIQVASAAKTHLASFSKSMKHMSKKLAKHGSMYAPLIHELVELTADVENEKGGKVVELLNQLLNLLINALADLKATEASEASTYSTHRDQDLAKLESNRNTAALDQQRIDEIAVQETQALANLDRNRQFLSDAEDVLARVEAEAQANEDNYADQRPRYDELISILERLIAHFNENVAAVDEWTASQINGQN